MRIDNISKNYLNDKLQGEAMRTSANIKTRHKAIYGNVELERMYCKECQSMTFVIDEIKSCCGELAVKKIGKHIEYIINPRDKRKRLSKAEKEEILNVQDGNCFYCGNKFGSLYTRGSYIGTLTVHWDHVVPFSFSRNNNQENIVASCNVCNLYKSNRMFDNVEELRKYLKSRFEQKRITVEEI